MRAMTVLAIVTALAAAPALPAAAATVDPGAFDRIFTEGKRTLTVDGADVFGHAAVSGNGDVAVFDMGPLSVGDDVLAVGRVVAGGSDSFAATPANGLVTVSVLNFAESSRDGESPFSALFKLFVGGALVETLDLGDSFPNVVENVAFGPVLTGGEEISLLIEAVSGVADYDVAFSSVAPPQSPIATAPAPAGLPLLFGGLAVLGMAACRKRTARNK